jgi:hypothetical protein
VVGVQWDVVRTFAFIGEFAVERVRGGGDGFIEGHGELEPDGKGDPEDVEARACSAVIRDVELKR